MRRAALLYSSLALATVAVTTGFVAHRVLDRPGATALGMVPANASAVMALDLVPAPDQLLAFKSIEGMIDKAPGHPSKDALIGGLLQSMLGEEALAPVSKQIDRSIALALLPKAGKPADDGEGVAMIPLKDAAAVAAYLKSKTLSVTVNGVPLMKLRSKKEPIYFSLQGDVLVAATGAWPVAAVAKVAQGQAPSLANVPAFAEARAKALPSANLLVLVGPGLAKEIKQSDWIVGSMTIRDAGMELAVDGRTSDKDALKVGGVRPLGRAFLDAIPRGAYGFVAMSQFGTALEMVGKEMDEPAKEMKKAIDVDFREDVIPALKGNVALAFYPSLGPDAGLDLLVSIDDANGADPARLARKLEAALDEEGEKHKGEMPDGWKTAYAIEGAEASQLAEQPAEELQKEILGAEKSFFRPLTMSKGKTVAWARVGKAVVLATSTDLLNRAVFTRRNPSSSLGLSGDAAFGANPAATADGQYAMAISMGKLATGIRNTVDPSHMSAEAATTYRKVLGLYENTTEPLALRAQMDAEGRYHSYFSVPMDWTKLASLVK